MIDKDTFDFDSFFKKYNLKYSDDLVFYVTLALRSPAVAYQVCCDNIRRKCPELEPVILEDAAFCYFYAKTVLKRKWPEAEPIIKGTNYWELYLDSFKYGL